MILHIDMDAFFASVEQLDNPELRGKCVIVGGASNRGVVSAASYEAREYGVRSAMPVFMAKQKCPVGVFVRPRHKRYKQVSNEVMAILSTFSPLVEQVSIDEAYLDSGGCAKLFGDTLEMAVKIKKQIRDKVGLTCSIGAAPVKFLAKIASDMEKPDGLTVIHPEETARFVESLPIEKVPGVGKSTRRSLESLGIRVLGDVGRVPEKLLRKKLGKFGERLLALSTCADAGKVRPFRQTKSVSSEETFDADTNDKKKLRRYLLKHAEDVGRELRKSRLKGRTVSIKIKYADFKQITRSASIDKPTQSSEIIYKTAEKLFDVLIVSQKIRLIGVGVSHLSPENAWTQAGMFDDENRPNEKWEKIDRAVDALAGKFGKDMVRRASLGDIE